MAVYTQLSKKEANEIGADYGLPKLLAVRPVRQGSVNTHYVLESVKGKFIVKIDEVKSEMEVKREFDLLLFLRKHGFPCLAPLTDRRGRHYREWAGKALSVYRHIDGHIVEPERLAPGHLDNVGRVLADLHLIGKAYKKGIESRFGFERV